MKIKNIIIGIVIVLFGILGILEASGVVQIIDSRITYLQIGGGLILIVLTISALFQKQIYSVLFLLTFLFMLFEGNIASVFNRDDIINNWLLLLFVAIICIGLSMIIPNNVSKEKNMNSTSEITLNSESHNFGGHMTYIDCSDFREKRIINRFGETEIHFENTEEYSGDAVLIVENIFGETRIYVPGNWVVSMDVKNVFGDSSNSIARTQNGPKLIIQGSNKFGEIDVIAV